MYCLQSLDLLQLTQSSALLRRTIDAMLPPTRRALKLEKPGSYIFSFHDIYRTGLRIQIRCFCSGEAQQATGLGVLSDLKVSPATLRNLAALAGLHLAFGGNIAAFDSRP